MLPEMTKCPLCNTSFSIDQPPTYEKLAASFIITCKLCKTFKYPYPYTINLTSLIPEDKVKVRRYLSQKNEENQKLIKSHPASPFDELMIKQIHDNLTLTRDKVEEIRKKDLPKASEQANNLIRLLATDTKYKGNMHLLVHDIEGVIIGSISPAEFASVIKYLSNKNLIILTADGKATILSVEGWRYYDQLEKGEIASKRAFMSIQFDNEILKKVFEEHFKPAVKQTGFELFRLSDNPKAGLIDNRLEVEIQTSAFVIADLSYDNLIAYFEAGYAEGLGKKVIYTCSKEKMEPKEQRPYFNINHQQIIVWDVKNIKKATEELKNVIRTTFLDKAIMRDDETNETA